MEYTQNLTASKMLRAKQISKLYNVGLSTIWHYVRQGKLKAINISKNVTLFRTDEVEKFFTTSRKEIKE
ncbi:helix-turn-helix domain-containing protein [Campylobacter sputorum]|uniref:helix-turn-helix domain-containing protein n=1 Tax=Campylobacter sputorum TaxID=206 RepID=UPI00053BED01|nr:helix-turn-helix domain-containing protein [Campylobacter sputorum]